MVGATKHALVVPSIVSVQNASSAGIHDGNKPFPTITSKPKGGGHAVVQVFLAKHYGGVVGNDLRQPLGTITQVDHHSLVALSLSKYHAQKGDESRFASLNDPINTLDTSNRFALVAAFLQTYYGNSTDDLRKRVKSDHKGEHFDDYMHVIQMVETHPGLLRAKDRVEATQTDAEGGEG